MSQRPHLGSISSSPGETTYLAQLTGHAATTEKRAEVQNMHIKPFPTSFNTLLPPFPLPYLTSWDRSLNSNSPIQQASYSFHILMICESEKY